MNLIIPTEKKETKVINKKLSIEEMKEITKLLELVLIDSNYSHIDKIYN